MIGRINVEVSAANPAMPLRPAAVFATSACTVGVTGVPTSFGTALVTGVAVSIKTPDGETSSVGAKRCGQMWVATFMATRFVSVGHVHNGLTVTAIGLEEDGETPAEWTLGKGDVTVLDAQGVPAPGLTWQDVHLRDAVPEEPRKGDLAKVGGEWRIYTGTAWETLGGGSVVESETNPGYAANADSANHAYDAETAQVAGYATEAQSANQAVSAVSAESVPWGGVTDTPTTVEGYGITDAAKTSDLAVVMDLVDVAGGGHEIRLGGVRQTFAQVKALAETRNAVIRHGRGTYRATYVGASEMMWDCTGTVQGEVMTGMIHMFAEGNVVQLVTAKALALKSDIGSPVEVTGEFDDGTAFSFDLLTAGA